MLKCPEYYIDSLISHYLIRVFIGAYHSDNILMVEGSTEQLPPIGEAHLWGLKLTIQTVLVVKYLGTQIEEDMPLVKDPVCYYRNIVSNFEVKHDPRDWFFRLEWLPVVGGQAPTKISFPRIEEYLTHESPIIRKVAKEYQVRNKYGLFNT